MYALVGAVVVCIGLSRLQAGAHPPDARNVYLLRLAVLLGGGALLAQAYRGAGWRWLVSPLAILWPHLWWAAVLGWLLIVPVNRALGVGDGGAESIAIFGVAELGVLELAAYIGALVACIRVSDRIRAIRRRMPLFGEKDRTGSRLIGPSSLRAWVSTDRPLADRSGDLFGARAIARELVDKLTASVSEGAGGAEVLLGPRGSGKTTLAMICEQVWRERGGIRQQLTVRVSLWPYADAAGAVNGILSAIDKEVGRAFDLGGAYTSSKQYLELVSLASTRVGLAARLLNLGNTEGVIERIGRPLRCTGSQLLVVVEDFERFDDHRRENLGPVVALLYALAGQEHIAVLLAAESIGGFPDIEKLGGTITRIGYVGFEAWLSVFDDFVDQLIFVDDSAGGEGLSQRSAILYGLRGKQLSESGSRAMPGLSLEALLWAALGTPRLLRRYLYRLSRAWPILRGEVDVTDLLVFVALDEAMPSTLELIEPWAGSLRTNSSSFGVPAVGEDTPAVQVRRELQSLPVPAFCRGLRGVSPGSVILALCGRLFPGLSEESSVGLHERPQAISAGGPSDYWRRLRESRLDPAESMDQDAIIAVRHLLGGDSAEALGLLGDEATVENFRWFASRVLGFKDWLRILEEYVDQILASEPSGRYTGYYSPLEGQFNVPVGILAIRRALGQLDVDSVLALESLASCCEKAAREDFRLLWDLQYWLGQYEENRPHSSLLGAAEAEALEHRYIEAVLDSYLDQPERLERSLHGHEGPLWRGVFWKAGSDGAFALHHLLESVDFRRTILRAAERPRSAVLSQLGWSLTIDASQGSGHCGYIVDDNVAVQLFAALDCSGLRGGVNSGAWSSETEARVSALVEKLCP